MTFEVVGFDGAGTTAILTLISFFAILLLLYLVRRKKIFKKLPKFKIRKTKKLKMGSDGKFEGEEELKEFVNELETYNEKDDTKDSFEHIEDLDRDELKKRISDSEDKIVNMQRQINKLEVKKEIINTDLKKSKTAKK